MDKKQDEGKDMKIQYRLCAGNKPLTDWQDSNEFDLSKLEIDKYYEIHVQGMMTNLVVNRKNFE